LRTEKYDSIQALRGISAMLVVLCHIHFLNGKGAFGVDIFFCISGFIMMHITRNGTEYFLIKRAIRILPLYYGITLLTYVVLLINPDLFHSSEASPEYLLKSLMFIPYARNGVTQPILGVGWTLNYEIWFYFLMYMATQVSIKYRAVISSSVIGIIVLIGMIIQSDSVILNFFTNPIILEFSLGMLDYALIVQILRHKQANVTLHRKIISLVVVCILIAIMYVLEYRFTTVIGLFRLGIPAFMILLIVGSNFENSDIPRILVWLGNISFSLYLVHYYTIFFFDRLVYPLDTLTPKSSVIALFAVAISIAVGFVSWWLIENKFTEWIRSCVVDG
jgi:exopolysaccharide production protein ExoZ